MLPTWRVISLDSAIFVSAFGETHEGHTSPMYRLTSSPNGALHRGSDGSPRSYARQHDRWWEAMVAVEAELKALARDPERIHTALSQRAVGEHSIYTDRYFDYPDRGWTHQGTELRVRTIVGELGPTQALLTFKEPAVDHASGSKPEHETVIGDADVLITVLTALGVEQVIAFEKHCVNYRFTTHGRDLLATVVTVPELAGQTFIELETIADRDDVDAALDVVRSVLRELGIEDSDLTTQAYTDAVVAQRSAAQ